MSSLPARWPRPSAPGDSRAARLRLPATLALAAGVVGASYALMPFTPLRIESDSTAYLLQAAAIADGEGVDLGADFPPGLPLLLAGLDAAGIGRSWAFVTMNLAFLALGLGAAAHVLRHELGWGRRGALAGCLVTLLSFSAVRLTPHPLSDVPFFGLSLAALALAAAGRRRADPRLVLAAVPVALAACAVRTAGIALVPALALALPERRQRLRALPVLALAGAAAVAAGRRYVEEGLDVWAGGAGVLADHVYDLARAAGEAAANAPADRLPDTLDPLLALAGAAALALAALGGWRLRRRAPVAVSYLAAVALLLLAWPLTDSRFVLPLTPLLLACVVEGLRALPWRAVRPLAAVWAAGFVLAGLVALVVTTRITFSGDAFPERYNANLRATYRVAWGTDSAADRREANPWSLRVLRRYEPRARPE